jgi:hypothetical protein
MQVKLPGTIGWLTHDNGVATVYILIGWHVDLDDDIASVRQLTTSGYDTYQIVISDSDA